MTHPITNNPELSVVIPCLNEAKTLPSVLARAQEALDRYGYSHEIVVADNGSSDSSPELARNLGARVIHVSQRGYGSALLAGIEAAVGRIIVIGDADDTYDFMEINRLAEPIRSGACEFVIGSRLRGTIEPGAMPALHRYLGTPVLTGLINMFFGTRISDCNCGLRACTADAFRRMEITSTGMEFASEMIIKAGFLALRTAEVPVSLRLDRRERLPHLRTWQDGWRHLRFILAYATDQLLFVPGALMIIIGLFGFWLLSGGPVIIGGFFMDYHFLFPSALSVILGTQAILFALLARTYTGLSKYQLRLNRLRLQMSVEAALLLGALIFLLGLGLNLAIVASWLNSPDKGLFAVRPAIVALTLMAVGAQIFFTSFFIGVLKIPHRVNVE